MCLFFGLPGSFVKFHRAPKRSPGDISRDLLVGSDLVLLPLLFEQTFNTWAERFSWPGPTTQFPEAPASYSPVLLCGNEIMNDVILLPLRCFHSRGAHDMPRPYLICYIYIACEIGNWGCQFGTLHCERYSEAAAKLSASQSPLTKSCHTRKKQLSSFFFFWGDVIGLWMS